MGVLNVTPDSFSDGGRWETPGDAIAHARALVAQGAQIIDVGGESTRPGAVPVDPEVERERVLGVIAALTADGIEVSIDTIHAGTARAAVAAGARIINDVSGGTHDPEMLGVAAEASREHGARFVIGHWRGIPDPEHGRSEYRSVVEEVRDALAGLVRAAVAAGVAPEHLILDPGLGFDKTGEQGWELLAGLDAITALGFPVLVGASRKRMIADALAAVPGAVTPAAAPAHERDLATAVVSALAARAGAWGVRVHDVGGSVQALAIERAWSRAGAARPSERSAGLEPAGASDRPSDRAIDASEPSAGRRDRISLTGLEVFAHHGVFDFERERGQRFIVDAEVAVDLRAASGTDELARTVHYGELAEAIVAAVRRDPVDLIETVAERVAAVALGFAGVRSARITVHKPDAPIDAVFTDVSVTVERAAEAAPGTSSTQGAGSAGPARTDGAAR
ncbi:dihydropteroate synthase [Leucobacter sp. CSA2]|uniref:7,8-dihydroneopterin aldolase n=2 Tax=Leucobacter edaphi TaxID=2796472 RepID=A0A934QER3_9MICO|nr:dihydropteroate synthase [Leucobacter edaphi]MBK0422701.1 dihydropteroate synthase [Leucobacter edaphi]